MPVLTSLRKLVHTLRDSEKGCPWVGHQDFASLISFTIEEAFEVGACIENSDWEELSSELGDLLYQIVLYCQIAEENDMFNMDDVVEKLGRKLKQRHPHVFASESNRTSKGERNNWEEIKRAERNQKFGDRSSELDDVPRALPSLTRAQKIQRRASLVGFDWENFQGPRSKVNEELEELDELLRQGDVTLNLDVRCREELGDVLFSVVNLARHLKIDPEYALTLTTEKFIRRFSALEEFFRGEGKALEEVASIDLEKGWQFIKEAEGESVT